MNVVATQWHPPGDQKSGVNTKYAIRNAQYAIRNAGQNGLASTQYATRNTQYVKRVKVGWM
jgi:hypothetical protein